LWRLTGTKPLRPVSDMPGISEKLLPCNCVDLLKGGRDFKIKSTKLVEYLSATFSKKVICFELKTLVARSASTFKRFRLLLGSMETTTPLWFVFLNGT
jgi:hypothetical protein